MEAFLPCPSILFSHSKVPRRRQSSYRKRPFVLAKREANDRQNTKSAPRPFKPRDPDQNCTTFSDHRSQVDKIVQGLADVKNRYERISDEVRTLRELPDDYILGSDISNLFIGSTSTVQDLPLPEAPTFHGLSPREILAIAEDSMESMGLSNEIRHSSIDGLKAILIHLRNWVSNIKEEAKLLVTAYEDPEVTDISESMTAFVHLLRLARFSIMPALPSVDDPKSPELIPLGTSKETTLDPSLIVNHNVLQSIIREQNCDLSENSFYPYVFAATRGVSVVRNSGLLLPLKIRAIERSYLGWIAVPFTILTKPDQVFEWLKSFLSRLTKTFYEGVNSDDDKSPKDLDQDEAMVAPTRAVRRIVPAVRLKSFTDAMKSLFFPSFTQEPCHELLVLMYREVDHDMKLLRKRKRAELLKQVRKSISQAIDPFAAMKAKQEQNEHSKVAGRRVEDFFHSVATLKPVCLHLYKDVSWGLTEHYFPSIYVMPATGDLLRLDALTLLGLVSAAITYVRHSESWFSYVFLFGSLVSYIVRVALGWRRASTEYKEKIASDKVANTVAQQWAVMESIASLAVEEAFAQLAAVFIALRQGNEKCAMDVEQDMYKNITLDAVSSGEWEQWLVDQNLRDT